MPSSPDGIISRVVKELNQKGPLRDMIYVPSSGVKKPGRKLLRFSGMCTSIKRRKLVDKQTEYMRLISDRNPLYHKDPDTLVQKISAALGDYFQVIDELFSTDEKRDFWLQNSGASVLVALYECILRRVGKAPEKQELLVYIGALVKTFRDQHYDVKTLRVTCSSEAGRSGLTNEFVSRIAEVLSDRDFSIPGSKTQFDSRIAEFEREFASFLVRKLSEAPSASGNWRGERIPSRVVDKLIQNYGKIPDNIADYLTLGDCNEIARLKNNWSVLRDCFVRGMSGFPSDEAFGIALDYVTEHRNAMTHKRPLRPGYSDQTLRDVYFLKLSKCLAEADKQAHLSGPGKPTNPQ
jgi:hypothetical protein